MRILRNYCLSIFCLLLPSLGFAQAPVDVNTVVQPYILVFQEVHPYHIYRLNTSTGEIVQFKYDAKGENSKLLKVEGCPEVTEQESYNGRFGFFQDKEFSVTCYLLIDHKTGQIWQLVKNHLIPISEPE